MVGDKELDTGFRCWSCKEFTTLRARIAELEQDLAYFPSTVISLAETVTEREAEINQLRAELAAIKAQEPVAYISGCYRDVIDGKSDRTPLGAELAFVNMGWIGQIPLYAAPVSEAKAQGEYSDAYQGAREDLAIWKRRALEAEKALQEERIITERLGNALNEENGPTFMGEPVFPAKAQGVVMQSTDGGRNPRYEGLFDGETEEQRASRLNAAPVQQVSVPDGYVLADKKSLGMVLQALVNAPHHIRELQATRQPVELFSDNPINVLIANYESPAAMLAAAPAAPAADAGDAGHVFYGMDGNHP